MDCEDLEPRKQPPKPKDLSGWSVEELNAYDVLVADYVVFSSATLEKFVARSSGSSSNE